MMQKLIGKVSPSGGICMYFVLHKGRNVIKSKETSLSYVGRKTLIEARKDGFLHPCGTPYVPACYGLLATSSVWTIKLQWMRTFSANRTGREDCGGPGDRDPVEGIHFWPMAMRRSVSWHLEKGAAVPIDR